MAVTGPPRPCNSGADRTRPSVWADSLLERRRHALRARTDGVVADLRWDGILCVRAAAHRVVRPRERGSVSAGDRRGPTCFVIGGTTLTYDAAGQVTTRTAPATDGAPPPATTYGYDGLGQRTSSTGPNGTTTYEYDQAGRLTSVAEASGATSSFDYDAAGLRSATTTSAGTQRFVWDTTASVARLLTDGGHQYLYGVGSTPVAQVDATTGAIDYLHADLIGSIRSVTDSTGAVVADSDYTAYGTPLDVNDTPVSDVTPFGYAGQYTDLTGLIYLRARYYDPATGQFLTIDPLVDTTRDAYGYTPGNPLQLVDPLGLSWLNHVSNVVAGFGDAVTFGGTKQMRRLINYELNGETDDLVDSCSAAYRWGSYTGLAATTVVDGAGVVAAVGRAGRVLGSAAARSAAKTDIGLSGRGLLPNAGTRIRPSGISEGWRISGTKSPGGVLYRDPTNAGNSVRVMQGNPNSPFPNSQVPYVRWQRNGQPLDQYGDVLASAKVPEAHIPLSDFRFRPEVFGP